MAEFEHILTEIEDRIGWIRLNRPKKMNAGTGQTWREIASALTDYERDDDIRVVIITGNGKAFCAGDDVKELFLGETDGTTAGGADATNTTSATPPISRTAKQLINHEWLGELEMLLHYSKPTIAAVNGAAVGYGCDLALMCDLRVASDRARFGELFIKRGLIPEAGGLLVLPHLVGWEKAHELVLTGDLIDAEEALRIGMIGRVVPHEKLDSEARDLAQRIAAQAPLAQRLAKEAFRIGRDGSIREFTDFQRNAQQLLFRTDDHREGARSFVEKREARFKGR
jgi:2-(1,2-epoxy-1,2-dihydrophenyl)acetyl-CoA isomerase